MRFNYNHVMVFLEVAEKGSINGAAQQRHVAQSAVSRIMRELELSLKVKLLERHAWGIEVTEAGRVVLQLAKNIRAEATSTDLALGRLREGNKAATLSIGAHPTLAAYVLPQVIGRFGERAPTCQVIVREGMKEDLIPLLSNGELDVLVCRIGNTELPSGLVEELIYHDTMVVLAGHQHPLATRRRLQPSDLLAAQWILPPPDAEPYKDVAATFDFLGIGMPTPKIQTASVGLIRTLLLGDPHWLAIMPRDMFRSDIRARRLKVLSEAPKSTHRPMGLILRRSAASEQKPQLTLFIDSLVALTNPPIKNVERVREWTKEAGT
jgi:DNA-binding transcriptional LysR family regulator